jgi:hypothetical protein
MAAFSATGKVINVGDRVSIIGTVVSASGSAQPTQLVIQPALAPASGQFTCNANDLNSTQAGSAVQTGRSISGKPVGNTTQSVTVMGVVTAISGSSNTATLTVTLCSSGLSVSVPAGSCIGDGF